MGLLPIPPPYDFELSLDRFRFWGVDRANVWRDGGLHRVVAGREVRIAFAEGGAQADPLDEITEPVVRKLLGLEFDLQLFYAFAQEDPVLAAVVRKFPGFRPPLSPDPFETLVSSITAQQVSLFAAFAIRNRLIERFGRRVGSAYSFPTRKRLARAREEELVAVGFSRRKAEYVLGLVQEPVDLHDLASLPDEEVKRRLVSIRGIGEWTAEWFLARHLARPRAWPVGDLALDKAVRAFYPEAEDIRVFGQRFDPFQNLTAHYLLTGARVAPP
jgi:DNA-3-methyladenine glycosylase II